MTTQRTIPVPKAGPDPLLLSRKEIDALYDIFDVVRKALALLEVDYIVTGGSLLGAIRQHSILFCDDDIDIAILDAGGEKDAYSGSVYETVVVPKLQSALDEVASKDPSNNDRYIYQIKPWEGGDRIRSKRYNNVFLDLFVLRKYPTLPSFLSVIGVKRNGLAQPEPYVQSILNTINKSLAKEECNDSTRDNPDPVATNGDYDSMFPFWQFSTRKAIEMWPKEVYRASDPFSYPASTQIADELFPLQRDLKFGPLTGICGPNMPVTLLKRAFGDDCFQVYYRSVSHQQQSTEQPSKECKTKNIIPASTSICDNLCSDSDVKDGSNNHNPALQPLVAPGGTWEDSPKVQLEDEHYLPLQPLARKKRRPTLHGKEQLLEYLEIQTITEEYDLKRLAVKRSQQQQLYRRCKTVYMDGVFDLFHKGHLEAIQQCANLGDRVILGVTGDDDATGYKRKPIVPQDERVAIVASLREVDDVICPCPLIVTEEFMETHSIDLVVHGFANDKDVEKQREFFQVPMAMGKFQRIGYYKGLSTTDRIKIIQERNQEESDQIKYDQYTRMAAQNMEEKKDETTSTILSKLGDQIRKDSPTVTCVPTSEVSKPQWFGATLAAATQNAPTIPTEPFPLSLRIVMEPHIEKARSRRTEALDAIRIATGKSLYDSVMNQFSRQQEQLKAWCPPNATEDRPIETDALSCGKDLLAALIVSAGLPSDTDLSKLHEIPLINGRTAKDRLLHSLTQNPGPFQEAYDAYVRKICVPRMASASNGISNTTICEGIYYQAFPCLRIVQPNEFSIGPHCDVAYGHHPCSINGYVSLTDPILETDLGKSSSSSMAMSSSLFLESRPGAEDWHALFSRQNDVTGSADIPKLGLFAGAINLHWTTENKTNRTRVSLDFRLIDGRFFDKLVCGGSVEGGQMDVYRKTPGYYHKAVMASCRSDTEVVQWERDDEYSQTDSELAPPDFRVGFPWTVKNWDKFWKKNTKQQAKTEKL